MINIRTGVFETNSSSMHTIVIGNGNSPHDDVSYLGEIRKSDYSTKLVYDDLEINEDGVPLMSWIDKLGYVLVWGLGSNNCIDAYDRKEFMDQMLAMVKEEHPEIDRIVLKDVQQTEGDYELWDSIDHQSVDLLNEFKSTTVYGIRDIVFNSNIVIVPVWDGETIKDTVEIAERYGLKNPTDAYVEWGHYTKEDWENR